MAKLSDLVEEMASLLGDPERSVNVRAMHLRREKLISSKGRGLHSAEMTSTDATNLLLACMHAGKAKDSPQIVALLREAAVYAQGPDWSDELFQIVKREQNLGDALDALLDAVGPQRRARSHVRFEVLTRRDGWEAAISFFDSVEPTAIRRFTYFAERPDAADAADADRHSLKWTAVGIEHSVLYCLTELLYRTLKGERP